MRGIKIIKLKLRLYKKQIVNTLAVILLLAALVLTSAYTYSENIQQGLAENLIRLHVIANSNSQEDQEVKYKVRDEILKYMSSQTVDLKSTDEAKNLICNNISHIEEIAKQTLEANGYNYEVKAYFGKFPFPTKVYGDVTLPAGEYQSLRVVLGKGAGANWWCVMFPPLCFVDASKGVVPDSSKAQMQNVLSEEEYNLAMSNSAGSTSEVKFKFKIVELLQQSKMKLAKSQEQ